MENVVKHIASLCESGKRTHNEDFVYPSEIASTLQIPAVNQLYIVCDGIGGANKGDVAARIAATSFAKYFAEYPPVLPIAQPFLDSALKYVEAAFDDYIKQHPECWGMGTTVALLYADSDGVNLIWAGNSRAYWFRKGERKYRTEDHTEVNQLVKEGKISEQEAQNHSRRHSILRAIQGSSYPTQLDVFHVNWKEIEEGDYFLLCSDGVLEAVKDNELNTLFAQAEDGQKIAEELQHQCQVESNDNYAAVVVQIGKKEAVAETTPETRNLNATENSEAPAFIAAEIPAFAETKTEEGGESESVETPKIEEPEVETPKVEAEVPKVETPKVELPKVENPVGHNPKTPPTLHEVLASDAKVAIGDTPEPAGSGMSATSMAILAVCLITLLGGLMYWYSSRNKTDKYKEYMTKADTFAKENNLDQASTYADSAYMAAVASENEKQQGDAMEFRNGIQAKKDEIALAAELEEAKKLETSSKYIDMLNAKAIYANIAQRTGDTDGKLNASITALDSKIAQTPPDAAYTQLMAAIKELCGQQNNVGAGEMMALVDKLAVKGKDKEKEKMRKDCNIGASEVAANDTRSLPTTKPANDNTTASTTNGDKPAPKPIVKPATPKSSPEVVASRDAGGNRPNVRTINNSGTATSSNHLAEGKRLYEKAKKENSNFVYAKAAAELEKAAAENKATGEAYYLLAVMYDEGKGVTRDAAKSLSYAKLSAQSAYHNGEAYYGNKLKKLGPNHAKEADMYLKRAAGKH
ncbi:MAG: protein phosphatase 2C domain-containing protein [Bacteroidia bacterium]